VSCTQSLIRVTLIPQDGGNSSPGAIFGSDPDFPDDYPARFVPETCKRYVSLCGRSNDRRL